MRPRPEERIAAAFNALFERFEIRLGAEDVAIGTHRAIRHRGWLIIYRVDPNGGLPELELYATHRMTSDRHVRISADGRVEDLDAIYEAYVFDAKVPGSDQAAKEKYLRHNRAVANELRVRGLYPDSDINASCVSVDWTRRGRPGPEPRTTETAPPDVAMIPGRSPEGFGHDADER